MEERGQEVVGDGPETAETAPRELTGREMEQLSPPDNMSSAPTERVQRLFVGTGLFWGPMVGVVLAVAFIILAGQNTESANISFLPWEFETPLFVVILISLVVGVVLDEIFGLVYRAGRRRVLGDREELLRLRTEAKATDQRLL